MHFPLPVQRAMVEAPHLIIDACARAGPLEAELMQRVALHNLCGAALRCAGEPGSASRLFLLRLFDGDREELGRVSAADAVRALLRAAGCERVDGSAESARNLQNMANVLLRHYAAAHVARHRDPEAAARYVARLERMMVDME